jgi:hypothetical protein
MHSPQNSPAQGFRPFVSRHQRGIRWVYSADEAAEGDRQAVRLRRWIGDASYMVLALSGWLAVNLLTVLGCTVAAFLVISGGNLNAFFLHLDNLASRYVEADLGRQAAFEHVLVQGFVLLFSLIMLLRAPGFIRRTRAELGTRPSRQG